MSSLIFTVDFDGTVASHEFPNMGQDLPEAVSVLHEMVARGHRIILNTMRSDNDEGKYLTQAVKWFADRDIPLFGVNGNPEQHTWTTSPKPYAHADIDDNNLGCPLIQLAWMKRPGVDWAAVRTLLHKIPGY